ncbi:unnamed protein product [Spirodela intermedia]|uniref:Uncharacterized protein n=1 Tax=Spirodela intermedia TaxID=51605 RepID=A0A7I8K8N9_SPIIN|nr:unnamed protein product [Spirodela intermedia]
MGRRIVFGGCHSIERKLATLRLSNGCHPTEDNITFGIKSLSRMCTTTPCLIVGYPLVTWKGSGAHVLLSVLAI